MIAAMNDRWKMPYLAPQSVHADTHEGEKHDGGGRRRIGLGNAKLVRMLLSLVAGTAVWISFIYAAKNSECKSYLHPLWLSGASSKPNVWYDPHQYADIAIQNHTRASRVSETLSLHHIVFSISGSAKFWPMRKELIKLWWRPKEEMRGFVWLDEALSFEQDGITNDGGPSVGEDDSEAYEEESLPAILVSEDTSRFPYTHPLGNPSGVRLARAISETFRLRLPGVKWFVLGDDDTLFNTHNLVRVLSKYDPSQLYYIGNPSESYRQSMRFSSNMAFGGGGIAVSYPLAEAISGMQDGCLRRYPKLFGSDDRLHACVSELGVPLTKEPGFHQNDLQGDPVGFLAAHPIAPFVSLHHLDLPKINPVFPGMTREKGLRHFSKAMLADPSSFLQQSICYDLQEKLTFSITSGYVVEVYQNLIAPHELQKAQRTFAAWNSVKGNPMEFSFDTRSLTPSLCRRPFRFYLENITQDEHTHSTVGLFKRWVKFDEMREKKNCPLHVFQLEKVTHVRVVSQPLPDNWFQVPRRQCSQLTGKSGTVLRIAVRACKPQEVITSS